VSPAKIQVRRPQNFDFVLILLICENVLYKLHADLSRSDIFKKNQTNCHPVEVHLILYQFQGHMTFFGYQFKKFASLWISSSWWSPTPWIIHNVWYTASFLYTVSSISCVTVVIFQSLKQRFRCACCSMTTRNNITYAQGSYGWMTESELSFQYPLVVTT